MFKTLNQNEMMTVNGGFYYVPEYNRYLRHVEYFHNGRKVGTGRKVIKKDYLGTQQVASDSGITAIYHDFWLPGVIRINV